MKRILVISYFFPPCNLTASNRPYSWAKYFNDFGYRPTIITRNWNVEIKTQNDLHKAVGNATEIFAFDTYDLISIPFKPTLRDRLFTKNNAGAFSVFARKFLTVYELLFQNIFMFATPYKMLYNEAKNELSKKKYEAILVTANPFVLFKFGHLLAKKFKLKWFADYRDDWSTSEITNQWYGDYPFLKNIAQAVEGRSEKKWLSNAACFFSVSEFYVSKISDFINKKGYVIYNGFIAEDFLKYMNIEPYGNFTVCFNGTLTDIQPIEIFLEGYKKLIVQYKHKTNLQVAFIGTGFNANQENRLKKLMEGFEQNISITKRLTRQEAILIQAKSQLMLLVAFSGVKGAPSSKIFDYLGLQKTVLLCPSDNDIKEKILLEYRNGFICNTADAVVTQLTPIINDFVNGDTKQYLKPNIEAINNYSRQNQTQKMVKVIDSYLQK